MVLLVKSSFLRTANTYDWIPTAAVSKTNSKISIYTISNFYGLIKEPKIVFHEYV